VTQDADDIPPGFPIGQAPRPSTTTTPRSPIRLTCCPSAEGADAARQAAHRNNVEFHLYRKFGADTSIQFETPDARPTKKTKKNQ
jgi:hypothetical protein